MMTLARRLDKLEERYRDPYHEHPARIPNWLRRWIDPLTIEDLEVWEAGLTHEEAGGDVADLPRRSASGMASSWNPWTATERG